MFPFDAEVLASSYALYNAAVWPAQVFALALALTAVWLTLSPRRWGGRAIGTILAAGWLWCGFVFFLQHFARLDFMAPVYGWAFVVQAMLLLWALVRRPLRLCASRATLCAGRRLHARLRATDAFRREHFQRRHDHQRHG